MRKKWITLLCCLLAGLVAVGCSSGSGDGKCQEAAEAAVAVATDEALDSWAVYGDDIYRENFQQLYNFSIKKVEDGAICYNGSDGKADEISIIKVADSNDVTEAKKYMEARLDQRIRDFQGYKPEESSKLNQGRVIVYKQYVILIISDNVSDMETAIKQTLK
jgi:hypothetical protein